MAPSSLIQDASQNMKVATVVSFYMASALIVRSFRFFLPYEASEFSTFHTYLPLLYLFNQLVIAIILLHGASSLTDYAVRIGQIAFKWPFIGACRSAQ